MGKENSFAILSPLKIVCSLFVSKKKGLFLSISSASASNEELISGGEIADCLAMECAFAYHCAS